jgi:hypothetical protein
MAKAGSKVTINRAGGVALWAAVVAECLGFDHTEPLTLGGAVAGFNAHANRPPHRRSYNGMIEDPRGICRRPTRKPPYNVRL